MAGDARFEDANDAPLRLYAADAEDLAVISMVCQDALGKVERIRWMSRRRRFSMLLYRFRWEDAARAETERRAYERVAAALTIDDVAAVRSTGIDRMDDDAVFSLLGLRFEPGEDAGGRLLLEGAANVRFECDVECLNVALTDLTRPWATGGKPAH